MRAMGRIASIAARVAVFAVWTAACSSSTEEGRASLDGGDTAGPQQGASGSGMTGVTDDAGDQQGEAGGAAGESGASGASGSSGELLVGAQGSLSRLVQAEGCEVVLGQIKQMLTRQVRERVDANLQYVLEDLWADETDCYGGIEILVTYEVVVGNETRVEYISGATEYSTTNLQVVGVDEADFVKNDAEYVYAVADGKLQIIDAWPASQAHTVSSVAVRGEPKKLFVNGDIAVVYSALEAISSDVINQLPGPIVFVGGGGSGFGGDYERECTHGYNCDFSGDGRELLISTYDISDKTAPVLLRETELSGSYLSSRRIGDIVHTAVTFPEMVVPGLASWPEGMAGCWHDTEFPFTEEQVREMFATLEAENTRIIEQATITDFLPSIKDTRYINGVPSQEEGLLDSCENFYLSQAGDGRALLALVSFDMSRLAELNATTIVGKPGAVYASHEALYLAVRHYSSTMDRWYFEDPMAGDEATTVHKFRLEPGSIQTAYAGSGVAKGRVLNQFSMDELDGYLRIATSSGRVPDPDVYSTLSVLAEQEGELEVVGMVDDIAPSEDIRSVRFNGKVGFVVTFKKTDPLFVFDLSDPTHPVIKAELKVPGFATYMHLMDDTHLLTMGYDADDQGSFAWFQGLQLRVLDVSDMTDPLVLSEETIGTRGSTSDAATNHLAFNYFPQRDLLALPMTVCEESTGGGSYGDLMTFSGLLVYRVTVAGGFELLGGVPHEQPETIDTYRSACSNWWTDSNSKVKRSIFMSSDTEDFVYSIAMDLINVSDLEDLENPLVSIPLVATP